MMTADERLDQIRKSHASARPKPDNPAWFHTHNDLTLALAEIDRLAERVRIQNHKLKLAFDALALYGVPMERAKSIENGIFVLGERYEKEIAALRANTLERETK